MASWKKALGEHRGVEALLLDALVAAGVTVDRDDTAVGCIGFVLGDYTHDKLNQAMAISGYASQGVGLFPNEEGDMFVEFDEGDNNVVFAVVTTSGAGDKYLEFSGY